MRIGIDLTACWRERVGMVTVATELAHALAAGDQLVQFASGSAIPGLASAATVLSPHRHELLNKLRWLPVVESSSALDVMVYPYWPSPPRRRHGAPPAVTFVHDLAFRLRPDAVPWQQRAYLGTVLPASLRGSAAILVPTVSTRDDLLDSYPVEGLEQRVHVVGEGPTPLPSGGDLPGGLEPGFLLAVGTIEPRKNYETLIRSYSRLQQAPPLVIAGAMPAWSAVRLPPTPGVRLLGRVDDATLGALYRHAAGFVMVSVHEGFGLPLLDAMAHGLPSLISREGSLPEVAGDGAVTTATDEAAVTESLRTFIGDESMRARLATAAQVRAEDFSWARVAARCRAVMASVAV